MEALALASGWPSSTQSASSTAVVTCGVFHPHPLTCAFVRTVRCVCVITPCSAEEAEGAFDGGPRDRRFKRFPYCLQWRKDRFHAVGGHTEEKMATLANHASKREANCHIEYSPDGVFLVNGGPKRPDG